MTHGHEYSVKFTLDSLLNAAHFAGVQLALFGHTHQAEYRNYGDLALLNPGSAGKGEWTCGLLTIEGGTWQWQLEYL
jgi:predicted phosphodiesterase